MTGRPTVYMLCNNIVQSCAKRYLPIWTLRRTILCCLAGEHADHCHSARYRKILIPFSELSRILFTQLCTIFLTLKVMHLPRYPARIRRLISFPLSLPLFHSSPSNFLSDLRGRFLSRQGFGGRIFQARGHQRAARRGCRLRICSM